MAKRIYAADDEENIREVLRSFLEDAGYETTVFPTGDALFAQFTADPCDLVILDIMMPGTDGLGICKKLRAVSRVPIILLTAKDSEMDYCMGMSYGGDDYLMKPFRPSMLVMRIRALFRRIEMERENRQEEEAQASPSVSGQPLPEGDLTFGDLTYVADAHQISCKGKDLGLTMTEFSLLRCFLRRAGKALSREELLNEVWGINSELETRVTDETVRRVRRKLKNCGSDVGISVIWGYGYKLEIP